MQTRSLSVRASDGTPLFVRVHRPASTRAHRTLVILHGAGQHGGRYSHLARLAVEAGWTTVVPDCRGHGRSGGTPTHLDCFDQYVDDLESIVNVLGVDLERSALFAHSMGGLTAVRSLQRRTLPFAAACLSSPLLSLAINVSPVKRAVGKLCLLIAPRTRFRTRISESQMTTNTAALEVRRLDPLGQRSVTAGWYFRVLDAVAGAWADAVLLTTPLLILQGDADSVVDPEAVYRWLPLVGSRDKTLRLFSQRLHELLHEPGSDGMIDELLSWLDRRVPAELDIAGCRNDRHFLGASRMNVATLRSA
ncbi:MAG: alpha/beta fold hydrolase [Planctomycetaceae bacterium]